MDGPKLESEDFTFDDFMHNITFMFKDCLFYDGIIQLVAVFYMYIRIGKGKIWKIFLYSSIALFIGKTLEHIFLQLINYNNTKKAAFILFIPLQTFYIIFDYTIPYINYLKLKVVCKKNYLKKIKLLLLIIFPIFAALRYYDGYLMAKDENINSNRVRNVRGVSYTMVAVIDFSLSMFIINELKKIYYENMIYKQNGNNGKSVTDYFKKSNYAILILVDFCTLCLSFLSYSYIDAFYMDFVMPFTCLKNNFIMILAIDSIIFRIDCSHISDIRNSEIKSDTSFISIKNSKQ